MSSSDRIEDHEEERWDSFQFTRPQVIAELSGNHGGSLQRALALVEAVAATGAQAVKLQTYTPDTLTLDVDRPEFTIQSPGSLWKGRSLYSLYEEAHTPWEWHEPIMKRARELGLACFSSPFDFTAVDFLESLDVPCYKIASFELVDLPLIRKVASTGKPMIMSTGAASIAEIDEAVDMARTSGCGELVLLKCTSSYPAPPDQANLRAIPTLRERYGCAVGLSDHTIGDAVAVAAVALGATVIEKHVTLDRNDGGVDSSFSATPDELRGLVEGVRAAHLALGSSELGAVASEAGAVTRRRSLYITADLRAGDELTADNLRSIRPGNGLAPRHYDEVLGRRLAQDTPRGTPLEWALLEDGP